MNTIDQAAALKYFADTDPVIASCIQRQSQHHDPPQLPLPSDPKDYQRDLCKMIVYQQISTKAAEAIWQRIEPLLQQNDLSPETLRENGLSRQKASYIHGIHNAALDLTRLDTMSDSQVVDQLTALKGIGRWSAEMFLMFSLARPDVFSIGDLGLRIAVAKLYEIDQNDHGAIEDITAKWSPHRTVASLSLWHMLDNRPVVL